MKQLRRLIVAAASDLNLEVGWSAVTMVRLADRVGVSRQTIYNEVGSKTHLAELVVHDAHARLLQLVDHAFVSVPVSFPGQASADVPGAIRSLVGSIAADPGVSALVAGLHGPDSGDSGPLALSYFEPQRLLDEATAALARNLGGLELDLSETERTIASSTLIRLALCAAVHPGSPPAQTADDLAWVAARLLGPG